MAGVGLGLRAMLQEVPSRSLPAGAKDTKERKEQTEPVLSQTRAPVWFVTQQTWDLAPRSLFCGPFVKRGK